MSLELVADENGTQPFSKSITPRIPASFPVWLHPSEPRRMPAGGSARLVDRCPRNRISGTTPSPPFSYGEILAYRRGMVGFSGSRAAPRTWAPCPIPSPADRSRWGFLTGRRAFAPTRQACGPVPHLKVVSSATRREAFRHAKQRRAGPVADAGPVPLLQCARADQATQRTPIGSGPYVRGSPARFETSPRAPSLAALDGTQAIENLLPDISFLGHG